MCARQNRETSRAQASWPCCWAEAADAIRTKGMTRRNRVILLCLTLVMNAVLRVLERSNRRRNAFVASRTRREWQFPEPCLAGNACVATPQAFPRIETGQIIARRPFCGPLGPDRGTS